MVKEEDGDGGGDRQLFAGLFYRLQGFDDRPDLERKVRTPPLPFLTFRLIADTACRRLVVLHNPTGEGVRSYPIHRFWGGRSILSDA